MGARDLVAAWEAEDEASGWTMPPPERRGRRCKVTGEPIIPRLPKLDSLPDPDEHGMAVALACCGPVEPSKVRALLLDGREDALTVAEADALHEWLDALLFARGEPEDDEQLALWCAALEQMA